MKLFSKIKVRPTLLQSKWARQLENSNDLINTANWIPLLRILRIFGNAPIQITAASEATEIQGITIVRSLANSNPTRSYEFRFRWLSIGTLCTFGMAIVRATMLANQFLPKKGAFCVEQYKHLKLSETEKLINSWPYYCLPAIGVFEWVSLLISMSDFVKFLNNWKLFKEILGESKASSSKYKKCGLVYLGVITYVPILLFEFLRLAEEFYFKQGQRICATISFSVWGFIFQIINLTENLKVLFMCHAVSTAMAKIRAEIEECNDINENIESGRNVVQKCQKAHSLLKEQVRLIGSSQGWHEIAYICYLILIMTMHIFLTLSPIFRGENPNYFGLIKNNGHLLEGLIRLYIKCHWVEEITKQEKLLADALFSLELNIPEAKSFADSIAWNPTKLVYGSVITMDKKLILKIADQIVTYIIILLQFQLSFGTNQSKHIN